MTKDQKDKIEEQDLIEEMEDEIEEIENEEGGDDEEKMEDEQGPVSKENEACKDVLAKTMADFENFKKRTERDRQDMIFFLKGDIFKKILPRLDDLERIIKNTPEELKVGALFEGVISIENKLKKDLDNLGVKSFDSIGEEVDPDKHDVMTTVPGKTEGIIFDEFEKGYKLGEKILRHAKVVVGAGE